MFGWTASSFAGGLTYNSKIAESVIPAHMKTIADFFTSSTFGFLLKLLSAMAALGFGIVGIGTETRAPDGKLNRNGWIAMIGIVIAGLIAVSTSIYEFTSSQQKEKEERAKSKRLMLSVQRGIYPFRGITASFNLKIDQNFEGLAPYTATLRSAIAKMQSCEQGKDIYCYGFDDKKPYAYRILSGSPLFPKSDSAVGIVVRNLVVRLNLFKVANANDAKVRQYKRVGQLTADLSDHAPEEWALIYDTRSGHIELEVDRFQIADKEVIRGNAYSLADVIPGAVIASPDYTDARLCYALEQKGLSMDKCAKNVLAPLDRGMSLEQRVWLQFPYPKAIQFGSGSTLPCDGVKNKQVVAVLLEDIESGSQLGERISQISKEEQKNICAAEKAG